VPSPASFSRPGQIQRPAADAENSTKRCSACARRRGPRSEIQAHGWRSRPRSASRSSTFGQAAPAWGRPARRLTGPRRSITSRCWRSGTKGFRRRFMKFKLPVGGNLSFPNTSLWQLFVYDPSGVQIELTFDADMEPEPHGQIAPEQAYTPGRGISSIRPPIRSFDLRCAKKKRQSAAA